MNVEIGAEASLFPEKEFINGMFVAVYRTRMILCSKVLMDFLHIQYRDLMPYYIESQ